MRSFLYKIVFITLLFYVAPAYALTSGTTTTGSITAGGTDNQSFSGTAGQGVLLYGNASYQVKITVYKPDGSLWLSTYDRLSGTLPSTGTYNVVISGRYPTDSGSYDLAYIIGAGSVSDGSLTSGQSASDSLVTNGINSYQFSGTAGQAVMLFGYASYTTDILVYRPDGSYWTYGYDRLEGTLPDTGTYTVVVTGRYKTDSGSYRLDYVIGAGNVSSGTLLSGQSADDSLEINGINSYQFSGTAGQRFMLYGDASYTTDIRVYKPDGSYWTYGYDRVNYALPDSGTYTVTVNGRYDTDSGPYRLDYVRGDDSVSEGTLVTNDERSGTLQVNGIGSYKFSGVAGNSLTVASTGAYTRRIYIYKPDGTYWTTFVNGSTTTLPAGATGDYTITLSGNSKANFGTYTLTTTTPPAPVDPTDPTKDDAPENPCEQAAGQGDNTGGIGDAEDKMAGNPINFDVGYKKQTEVDYNAGGLYFSRIYRSDSTWTDNTIGDLWRHNYARTLSVGGSTAEITDGTGATTHYTLSGSDWVADDPDITATLEDDGSGGYVYTLPNNTVEKYNSSEQLTRIEYLGGGALNLAYNGSGELTSVTNENGRQLTLTYSSGRVATLVTPDGTFSYSYDANDNLEEVTKPDTNTREYHYENGTYVNALTGITDEAGVRFATFGYDANGKAVTSEHNGSVDEYTITYNADDTSTVTNPLGKDTTYHYTNILGVRRVVQVEGEVSTNCVASNRYYNYDEKGRVIGKTDWENNTTHYEYDNRDNITKITEGYGTAEQRVTTITYNTSFNLPELITETGKTTDYDYDTYGRVTSATITDTSTSETRITTYSYYANTTDGSGNLILGRLEEINGPRTDVSDITEFEYDANFNLTKITNALGQEMQITARDSAGRPTTFEDPNGVETDLVYDSNGWLESSTIAPGTALEAQTNYDYDANGNLTEVTLPNGVVTTYSYDNAQRLTGIEDALGNTITYTLDDAGNITQTDYEDSTPTLKYTHTRVFDELTRIIESVGAAAQTSTYEYDKNSNLTEYTDANTNDTTYAYDSLQRLVDTTDALSGVTELSYNERDDLTAVEDQRDNTTTYTYNAFGDVTGETSPDRGAISYTVDKAGNITQRTDARSVVTDYTYDAINRLTKIEYPSDSSLDVTLSYDLVTGCGTSIGRLCKIEDASGVTEYEYDDLGRLTDVTETRGALSFTTSYTYDLAGYVTGITLPSGRDITYTRNANGQVRAVSADINSTPTSLASSIAYLPFGPMNAMTYGNSLTYSATYDTDYRLTNRTVSGSIYNHTYDTDANGNITQKGSTDYAYDELNRLEEEDSGSAVTYTYDATSNRLTKVDGGTTSTTVPSSSNKISAVGSDSYTYDAAGNITSIDVNDYTWNAAGQLEEVEISSSSMGTYVYDSQNHRTSKTVSSVTTHYVYGIGGLLYGEYDSSGNMLREYVYLNGQPLAQIDDVSSSDVVIYLHTDHLGTPRFGTNSGGTQVWAWDSDAFGVGSPSGSVTVNLRMPGQYYDSESGLFYNWNRYYNPEIGRYISSDPIGLEGGLNTFSYALANPVMYVDPEGLCGLPCLLGAVVGVALVATDIWDVGTTIAEVDPNDPASAAGGALMCMAIVFDPTPGNLGKRTGVTKSAGDLFEDAFEEAFKKRFPDRKIVRNNEKINQHGRPEEIDFETDDAIIEVKSNSGKDFLDQIKKRINDKSLNPDGKPCIALSCKKMPQRRKEDINNVGGIAADDIDDVLDILE